MLVEVGTAGQPHDFLFLVAFHNSAESRYFPFHSDQPVENHNLITARPDIPWLEMSFTLRQDRILRMASKTDATG